MAVPNSYFSSVNLKDVSDHHSCLLRLGSRFNSISFNNPGAQFAPRNTYRLAIASCSTHVLTQLREEEASSSGSSLRERSAWRETLDKNGRLRSPRAARELALCVLYAGVVSDRKPMWIFKQRLKQASGDFSLDFLTSYSHQPENEDCIFVDDADTKRELEKRQDEESLLEAAVLSAPLALVYNKFVLMMAENIIQSTYDSWPQHEVILDSLLPKAWKEKREGTIIPLCILHMAVSEIVKMKTSSAIVINEAVELTKRFSNVHTARVINGCLGKFVAFTNFQESQLTEKD